MVRHPVEYSWSSYRVNAQGEQSVLIQSHDLYNKLAGDGFTRQLAYRDLFRHSLPGLVDQIRQPTNGNVVLVNDRFSAEISKVLGKRVTRRKPGRPGKALVLDKVLKTI